MSSNWSATGQPGDANGDGIVNIFDINLISSNWGTTGSSAAAVPEPATLILGLCGLLGVVCLRGRHRKAPRDSANRQSFAVSARAIFYLPHAIIRDAAISSDLSIIRASLQIAPLQP